MLTLLLLLAATLGVGWLLTRSSIGEPFEQRDGALGRWLAAHRTPVLDAVSGPVGDLGRTWIVVGIAVVAAIVSGLVFRSWRPVVVLALALVGELAVFLTTTVVIDRPRPPVPHLDAHLPPTSSFPSGHTAAAVCLYGAVAVIVLAGGRGRWRRIGPVLALVLVLAVAFSRLYRGAHYPTDVVASLLFAGTWLVVVLKTVPLPALERDGVGEWTS